MRMSKNDDSIHPTAQRLESWLAENKIVRIDFLKKLDIKSQKYNNWRKRGIAQGEMTRIAKEAGMNYDYLRYGQGSPEINETGAYYNMPDAMNEPQTRSGKTTLTIKVNNVPLLSKQQILNRDLKPQTSDVAPWINPTTPVTGAAFAFNTTILNTDMERYGYDEDTTIYVDPNKAFINGKPVLITDNHGTLAIRHIERIGDTTFLCSKSPLYGPIELNESIVIIGAIAGAAKTY